MNRGRQYSRALIHGMHEAEGQIRASVSGEVKVFSQAEIEAVEGSLLPPKAERSDYRDKAYV